jgi:hypothetical protein
MIRAKLILRSMLSLPVMKQTEHNFSMLFLFIAYVGVLILLLKIFSYNKDNYDSN